MPFKPGDPNINRNGRPRKGNTLTEALAKYAEMQDAEVNGVKVTRKEALALIIWEKALHEKNSVFINIIYDRLEGKPIQKNEISGPDGKPVEYKDMTDEELDRELEEIEQELANCTKPKKIKSPANKAKAKKNSSGKKQTRKT